MTQRRLSQLLYAFALRFLFSAVAAEDYDSTNVTEKDEANNIAWAGILIVTVLVALSIIFEMV